MVLFTFKKFQDLTTFELYKILELRQEVFTVEQDCVYQDNDNIDQMGYHLCGYNLKGDLVAYARILGPGTIYTEYSSIGRVVNKASLRKKGMGKQLMKLSILRLESLFPHSTIKITAQSYLLKFYHSFGFTVHGDEYLLDGIPHHDMLLEV